MRPARVAAQMLAWRWSCLHGNRRSKSSGAAAETYRGSRDSCSQSPEHGTPGPGNAFWAGLPPAFVTYLFINSVAELGVWSPGVGLHKMEIKRFLATEKKLGPPSAPLLIGLEGVRLVCWSCLTSTKGSLSESETEAEMVGWLVQHPFNSFLL